MANVLAVGVFDWIVIAAYLCAVVGVVVYLNRRNSIRDSADFFLGGRTIPWWAIGCSLFASNVGTDHLVGLAGSGAAEGLAVGLYEWNAAYILLLLGFAFVPHYLACNVYTVPEYLEKRFSKRLRTFFMALTIFATLFTKITVTIFAGAIVLEEIFGLNIYLSSVGLLSITGLYCTTGGLAAIMYTEVIQVFVLLLGTSVLLYIGLSEVGGWTGLSTSLPASRFQLVKPLSHHDYPWLGVLVGMPINSVWYWCTDQVMVQRVLGTDDPAEAQRGCVLAGWLKISPMYLMVVPGLIAAVLFPDEMAADSNKAFPTLVVKLMPPGLVGVMVAAMLSSFMGALASCFNSCSTLFTMDVYKEMRPDSSEVELVQAGRLFTLIIAAVSVMWLPMITKSQSQLFLYIQGMQNIWCGPIACVFLASLLSDRIATATAWATLGLGMTLGLLFWVAQNLVPPADPGSFLGVTQGMSILLFAPISFAFSTLTLGVAHWVNGGTDGQPTEESSLLANKLDVYRTRYAKQVWAGTPTRVSAACCMFVITGLFSYYSLTSR